MPAGNEKPNGARGRSGAMATVGLALAIPGTIFVPALVGWWIDSRYATSPLWFLIGLFIGLLGAAYDIYKLLQLLGKSR
ncbi:MAG TPA: AtpZ/AtpI family protein [Blastocatellia bacterium]|nr:AtpZ/AtpI family protein [Blastocatellia bacterium]